MPARARVLSRPSLRPALLLRAPFARRLPFPLDQEGCSDWLLARVAIWHGLRALGLRAGDRILMPAYHCGSEVDPALRLGLRVDFYPVSAALEPDLAAIARLAPGARALYVTHFFGFAQPLAELTELARAHGMLMIEDCAHALHGVSGGSPLGSRGDAAVFSLRKSLPTQDGGLLLLRSGPGVTPPAAPRARRRGWGGAKMLLLDHLAVRTTGKRVRVGDEIAQPAPRALVADLALDPSTLEQGASPLALALARAEAPERVRERRRANYLALRRLIGATAAACFPAGEPAPGLAPWILPVAVDDPDAVRDAMIRAGVQAFRVWGEEHPAVDLTGFPAAAWLKRRLVGLPVHQELRPRDLERIASAFSSAVAGRQAPPPEPEPAAAR